MTETTTQYSCYTVEQHIYHSKRLGRDITLDVYLPKDAKKPLQLLLVNDGQDLPTMPFAPLINGLLERGEIVPTLVVGMYCSEDRKLEYGTADIIDYMERGSKARLHRAFILEELLPFIKSTYKIKAFTQTGFAGFSLGGLSAMDIAWKHPEIFQWVGVFSGSFWWRSKGLHEGYNEDTDRIMHQLVREGSLHPGQRFFFECGTHDETADRNNNGIIDSIDDTLGLIAELEKKGYQQGKDIVYLEVPEGHHDVATWAKAFPEAIKQMCKLEN